MKVALALLLFGVHMALAVYLYTMPSTPVVQDVPGLIQCEKNEYGGYEIDCMAARAKQMEEYSRTHPPPVDYRARDAVAMALALAVGVLMQKFLGRSRRAVFLILGVAYFVPVGLGLVSLWSALALGAGILLGRLAQRKKGTRSVV